MANTKSAKKAIRRIARQTVVNRNRRSRVRGFVRNVEEAISAKDAKKAREALKAAEPEIMRSVTKGVTPKRTAARKVSRLAQRVKALSA
jgi:small subunit ribosomal protein S20